jgi:hypothetical protein
MAVVNVLSNELTDINSTPAEFASSQHMGQTLKQKSAYATMAAADDNGSTYRYFRVRSSDSIKAIYIYTPGIAGTTDIDIGLYTISNGAAVDADLYGDGLDLTAACPAVPHVVATAICQTARFGDATTAVVTDINNRVWEDLGLTSDPGLEYDLVLTANAAASAAGSVAIQVLYTSAGA